MAITSHASNSVHKDRAFALSDILSEQNIYRAWESVARNNGGPGLDHVTVEDYARRCREELTGLQRDVREGVYRPAPLMVFQREKAHGGQRELTIASIRDRILARAIAQVLNERLDAGFTLQSYAYRFRKGALKAVSAAQQACRKFSHVLRADIAEFFDRMDHDVLADLLKQAGVDAGLLGLIMKLVRAPRFDGVSNIPGTMGVPQGSPLSPVLANLYLDPVDKALATDHSHFIRYADDLVIFCPSADEASGAMRRLEDLLQQVQLTLSVSKTRVYRIEDGFLFLGFVFTPAGHSAGQEARERLREKLDEGPCADEDSEEYRRRRESIVRGWNNYFEHGEPVADNTSRTGHRADVRRGNAEGIPAPLPEQMREDEPEPEVGRLDVSMNKKRDSFGDDVSLRDLRRSLVAEDVDFDGDAYRDQLKRLAGRYDTIGLHGAASACRKAIGEATPRPLAPSTPVSHGCRTVDLWMDVFAGGEGSITMACLDRLGRMGYRPHANKLTPQLLEHHWQGRRTLAVPVYHKGDLVRFGVIDIDISRRVIENLSKSERTTRTGRLLRDAVAIAQRARQAGVRSVIESSGYKGFHVWFFLHQPVEAALMRRFLVELARISGPAPDDSHRELFPASDTRPPEGLQTHIRLPLGVHKLTGERTAWITPEGDAWEHAGPDILDFTLLNRARVLKDAIATWTKYQRGSSTGAASCQPQEGDASSSVHHERATADMPAEPESKKTVSAIEAETMVLLRRRCPVLEALIHKARTEHQLAHGERMVLRGILEPLGPVGTDAIHAVMKNCDNYDRKKTNAFLGRPGVKPMACGTIKEVLGDFCEQVGCHCRFKNRKGDYAHPLRHLQAMTMPSTKAKPMTTKSSQAGSTPAAENSPQTPDLPGAARSTAQHASTQFPVASGTPDILSLLAEYRETRKKMISLSREIQSALDQAGPETPLGRVERAPPDAEGAGWVIRA
ncbi:MAG TPA: reverse transcriptase domain-containing protein [Kiritimatiellia bacterium]|nr:reverse transcriptase domain-containing protein [Kiritimatiellia bacterium]HMO98485.1 reverse transcriptase domain-containing protein [Kiritimatiellia bacterium]HMP95793.1 reverse transcriptase domain-containing protein [Kiritimatiellia bacterium]